MALPAWGSLEHRIVLKTKRMAVLKKRVYPAPEVGAVEALTQVALKQRKTTQLS